MRILIGSVGVLVAGLALNGCFLGPPAPPVQADGGMGEEDAPADVIDSGDGASS
jgi:hypothetical protein